MQQTLREARKQAGISMAEMAHELGVSRPTYSKIEKDPTVATVLQAKRICQLLSKNYEYIFFGKDDS